MVSTPLQRVFPAVLTLAVAAAVVPVTSAVASPDPTKTTAVAARACAASMQQYPLDDDVDIALQVRLEAWREAAGGTVTGTTEEMGWAASATQVAALQVALTWMSAASVRELKTLDDDDLRTAEDDLVWSVSNLTDRRLSSVLARGLVDRTDAVARLRGNTEAAQAMTAPASTADTRPDVTAGALVRFQRRLTAAISSIPDAAQADVQHLRSATSVHGLGAVGTLLEWTQQQGQRGAELLQTWDGAGAVYAAALRSITDSTAGADTYAGVLDSCVRTLQADSDDQGLTVKQARVLARSNVTPRLDQDGTVRTVAVSAPKATRLQACATVTLGAAPVSSTTGARQKTATSTPCVLATTPATKAVKKPAAKSATTTATKPAAKTATTTATKPAAKSATATRPATRSTTKATTSVVTRPATKSAAAVTPTLAVTTSKSKASTSTCPGLGAATSKVKSTTAFCSATD